MRSSFLKSSVLVNGTGEELSGVRKNYGNYSLQKKIKVINIRRYGTLRGPTSSFWEVFCILCMFCLFRPFYMFSIYLSNFDKSKIFHQKTRGVDPPPISLTTLSKKNTCDTCLVTCNMLHVTCYTLHMSCHT